MGCQEQESARFDRQDARNWKVYVYDRRDAGDREVHGYMISGSQELGFYVHDTFMVWDVRTRDMSDY